MRYKITLTLSGDVVTSEAYDTPDQAGRFALDLITDILQNAATPAEYTIELDREQD